MAEEPTTITKPDEDALHQQVRISTTGKWLMAATVLMVAIGAVVLLVGKDGDGAADEAADRPTLFSGDLPRRACSAVETLCEGAMGCKGGASAVVPADGDTPEAFVCCREGCSSLPTRSCTAGERVCDACEWGGNIAAPAARSTNGQYCCSGRCYEGDGIEHVDNCYSSETACALGDRCLNSMGRVALPRGITDAHACCPWSTAADPCVKP